MRYTVRKGGVKHTVEAAHASEDVNGQVTFLDAQGRTVTVFENPQEWYRETEQEKAAADEAEATETARVGTSSS